MKRAAAITLIILLTGSIILAGCTSPETTPEPTAPAQTTPAPGAEPVYDIKFSYHTPPQASLCRVIYEPWAQAMEEASGGKLKITHYSGGSLVGEADAFDAVLSGLADMAVTRPSVTAGRFPLAEGIHLPFLWGDSGEVASRVYHELLIKYCVDTELKDVKLLLCPTIPPSHYCGNKPLQGLEDFKGLKLPAGSGEISLWLYQAVGATPVDITIVEFFTSLERGLLDGVLVNPEAWMAFKLFEVTKHRSTIGGNWSPTTLPIVMNLQTWEKLPNDIKKIFEENSGPEQSAYYNGQNDALEPGVIEAIKGIDAKVGNPEWYVFPAEELAKCEEVAGKPIWDKWQEPLVADGLPADDFVQDVIALVEKYS